MMAGIGSLWVMLAVKTTLLLTLAWLIHVTLTRFNPRWRVLLWRGTACGLVLVAVWTFGLPGVEVGVPMSGKPVAGPTAPTAPAEPVVMEAIVVDPVPLATAVSREASISVGSPSAAPPIPVSSAATSPAPIETPVSSTAPIPWKTVLLSIWSLGIAVFTLRLAIGHLRLSRHLARSCTPAPDSILTEVRRVASELGCRRQVRVLQSPKFTVPFIVGIFRPVLVLSEKMCEQDYASRLPGILAHELSHVRSGDFAWNLILQAVSIPLWFHPLAWRIASAHRAACDAVCDAVSASYLGDVRSYCRTLAKVALEDATSATCPAVGLAMARSCDVRRRVAALERAVFATPLRRRAVAASVLLGLLASVLLAGVELTRAEGNRATLICEAFDVAKDGASPLAIEPEAKGTPLDKSEEAAASEGTTLIISGRIRDMNADIPLKKFRVKGGYERGAGSKDVFWRESWTVEDQNGEYRIVWNTREMGRRAVRIEAEGHISTEPLFVDADKKEVTFDPSLAQGHEVRGIIRAPDGTPVRDAEIAPRFPYLDIGELYVRDGYLDRSFVNWSIRTDAEGRFSLGLQSFRKAPVPIGATSMRTILFVVHDEGVAEVEMNEDCRDQNITLLPWARAEGTLRIAGRPAAGERVCLYLREMPPARRPLSHYDLARRRITFDYATQTDAEGRFVFERVFPAEGRVLRCAVQQQGPMKAYIPTHSAKAKFAPGKTTRVDIRRDGRPVTGNCGVADASLEPWCDWRYASALLVPCEPPPQLEIPWPRRLIERKDEKALKEWLDNWKKTPEGQTRQATIERFEAERRAASFGTNVKPDGSFWFEDIPAGEYELRLKLQKPPKEGEFFPGEVVAEGSRRITVPEIADGHGNKVWESGGAIVNPVKK